MVRRVARSYAKDVNQIPLASNGICDVTYFVVPHFSPLEGEFAKCLLIFVSVGDSRTRHCVCFAGRYSDDLNGFDVLSAYTGTFICSKIMGPFDLPTTRPRGYAIRLGLSYSYV